MKVKWKMAKVQMPHCGECGEMFYGDNSQISPYRCSCGIWTSTYQDPLTYFLKTPHENQ
jgi:hypothetical protein